MVAAKYPSEFFTKHANQFQLKDKMKTNNISTKIDHHHIPRIEIKNHFDPILKPLPKIQDHLYLSSKFEELQNRTLIFNVEETLLKSTSWFPFFMLVAFEGGGLIRALLLLLLYPLLCLLDEEWKLKIMVFVCFFGIKRSTFRIGRTVLPKFFLEDVGYEGFELITRFGKKVAVTNLPRVMVEGFLKDYLGIETIIGREIKAITDEGYYLGLLDKNMEVSSDSLTRVLEHENINSKVIAMVGSTKTVNNGIFTNCEGTLIVRFPETALLLTNAFLLAMPPEALAETCDADNSFFNMPVLLLVALIGATVGGLLARQRRGELTVAPD